MSKLLRKMSLLSGDRRGSQPIEFAFAAPVLLLMTCGIFETGMVLFLDVLIESGMRDAARYGITGQAAGSEDRMDRIIEIVEDRTVGLVDMDEAEVSVLSYPAFSDVGRGEEFVDGDGDGKYALGETFSDENGNGVWDEDVGEEGAGGSGQVVVYRIAYDWKLMTPLLATAMGDDKGNYRLESTVVVSNEPWE